VYRSILRRILEQSHEAKKPETKAPKPVRCGACNSCLEADSRDEKVTCSRWPQGMLHAPDGFRPSVARPADIGKELS